MTAEEAIEALQLCAAVYESAAEWSRTDDGFVGALQLTPSRMAALLRLDELGAINGVRRNGRRVTTESIAPGSGDGPVEVDIVVPRSHAAYFAYDHDDLLSSPANRLDRPALFYLADLRYLSSAHAPPPVQVAHYEQTLSLVRILSALADHVVTAALERTVIFLGKEGKLELPIVYTASDLRPLTCLDELESAVIGKPHEEVKRTLFRSAVVQLVAEYSARERLSVLLRSFDVLSTRFAENYALFVSGFSFDTELAKVHEAKREYLLKLNAALNDIHAKLIAIPVAVVLVGGQMKSENSGAALLQNVVLLAGAVVFAALMMLITANQRHSLKSIRQDYEAREGRLRTELPANLFAQTRIAFEALTRRYVLLRRMLFAIDGIVIVGLLFSVGVFVWVRREADRPRTGAATEAPVTAPQVSPTASPRESGSPDVTARQRQVFPRVLPRTPPDSMPR